MDQNKKSLVGKPTGRKSTADKETYITPEGEEVSEKSVSFPIRLENKVVWVNAPSIYNGVQHSEEEVRDKINAGEVKATSVHESREEAEEAAKKRSEGLLKNYAVGGIVNADDPEAQLVENADKTPVSPTQFAKGAGKAAFQTAKGVATGAVGITGDLISISQGVKEILSRTNDEEAATAFVRGMEQKTGLPTTEDVNTFIDQWLPTSLKSGSMAQDIGEMASPGGAVKAIAKGAKKAAPMLAKEAATQTEKLMRKQGLMPSIVPEGKTLTRSPYDAVGLTDEGVEEWRTLNRVKNRQEPIDEVKAAAQKLRDGEISSADYRQIVKEYQPIIPLKEVPKVPTLKELVAALNKDKVETGVVGINKTFKDGEKVASRLDIPAYDNYDTWVVSLHDGTKTGGKSLGYAQTAVLKNVDFRTAPSGALKIATKDKAKETIARIHGDWVNESSESVAKRAEEAINSTEWTQIGMNPFRHSYFYDKADGMPVVEAAEIIQVGPLVLAKKPKYASPDDPQFRIRKNDETSPTFAVGGVVEDKQNKKTAEDIRKEEQLARLPDLRSPVEKSFLSSLKTENRGPNDKSRNTASIEFGDDSASVSPTVRYNENNNVQELDDGVILDEKGKRIGISLNGQVRLNEGISVRGGVEKVFSSSNTTVYKAAEVIDKFKNSNQGQTTSLGATLGNVDVDLSRSKGFNSPSRTGASIGYRGDDFNLRYSQDKQDGMPAYKNLSGNIKLGDNLNVSGGIDSNKNKNIQVNYNKKYAKGGNVEQMNKLFADGGMMDDSGESVNGVEVPPGSLREEVADDIPAQLSEGEFVVPADVVRYIGLEKLMAMRDKAKQGLQRMNEMGQMGNAEEVANPDQTFSEQGDEDFEAEIDDIMAEEGDDAMPEGFARGGIVKDASSMRWAQAPGVDVRYFKHPDGRLMFITYINGKPSTSIPDGFVETKEPVEKLVGKVAEEKEEVKQEKIINEAGSGGDTGGGPTPSPTPKGFQTTAKSTAALKAMDTAMKATPIAAFMPGMTTVYGLTKGFNAALNAQNAALLADRAETAGVNAGWTPAAIDAGSKAAAQEAGREGATKGSIAAAAADAMAATDGRNPMDAMMATIGAAQGVPDVQGPDTGAGYSGGTASEGGQPGTDFGDPGRGNMYAKGGMVKKRPAKAKPTKKGLAAKK
jgi:hypothetical protein